MGRVLSLLIPLAHWGGLLKARIELRRSFRKRGTRCFRVPGRQSLLVFSGLEVKVIGKGTQAIRFSLWVVLAKVATQVAVTA